MNEVVCLFFSKKISNRLNSPEKEAIFLKQYNVKNRLIEKTISVIASDGLDKTTPKSIVKGTDINEAYIYRFFSDKDDLLCKTFDMLDNELVSTAMTHISVMYISEIDYEVRCRIFFNNIWKFLLGNKEKCLAFIRYYYSPYFQKYSAKVHKERYEPLVEKFKDAFRKESNVWMILNHILNVMLDFAIKVFNENVPNDDDTEEHVFRLVYYSIQQYFKEREAS